MLINEKATERLQVAITPSLAKTVEARARAAGMRKPDYVRAILALFGRGEMELALIQKQERSSDDK